MLLKLTKYDLKVRYVPGKQQVLSDCLSRAPVQPKESPQNEYDDVVLFLCIYKDITAQKEDLSSTTMFSGLSKFAKIAWSLNKYNVIQFSFLNLKNILGNWKCHPQTPKKYNL